MNHYPLIGRKMYGECRAADPTGSVDPHGPISCSKCRDRIAAQVAAKREGAATMEGKERRFFEANASALEKVLSQ